MYYADNQDLSKPLIVSSSMIKSYRSCQSRFAHRFIQKTAVDSDYAPPHWGGFGRAYHAILERMLYKRSNFDHGILRDVVTENKLHWESDGPKLLACVFSFFENNELLPSLDLVACEVNFANQHNQGAVDAIFRWASGGWFIVDNKTVGVPFDAAIASKISSDIQMNMYAINAPAIAKVCTGIGHPLHADDFLGVLYWEVRKVSQRYKEGETFDQFYARIKVPDFRSTVIAKAQFNPSVQAEISDATIAIHHLQTETNLGVEPPKSRNNCVEFGTPCAYYSKCHNMNYSDAKTMAADFTASLANPNSILNMF